MMGIYATKITFGDELVFTDGVVVCDGQPTLQMEAAVE